MESSKPATGARAYLTPVPVNAGRYSIFTEQSRHNQITGDKIAGATNSSRQVRESAFGTSST
jgi:hypothetical protein